MYEYIYIYIYVYVYYTVTWDRCALACGTVLWVPPRVKFQHICFAPLWIVSCRSELDVRARPLHQMVKCRTRTCLARLPASHS